MDSSQVMHLSQCWEAHKNKQRELNLVHENLLKGCLKAIAEGHSLEDIMAACGFSLETKDVECESIFGPHTPRSTGAPFHSLANTRAGRIPLW